VKVKDQEETPLSFLELRHSPNIYTLQKMEPFV